MKLPKGFRKRLEKAYKDESFSYNYGVLARIAIREFHRASKPKKRIVKPKKPKKKSAHAELEKLCAR